MCRPRNFCWTYWSLAWIWRVSHAAVAVLPVTKRIWFGWYFYIYDKTLQWNLRNKKTQSNIIFYLLLGIWFAFFIFSKIIPRWPGEKYTNYLLFGESHGNKKTSIWQIPKQTSNIKMLILHLNENEHMNKFSFFCTFQDVRYMNKCEHLWYHFIAMSISCLVCAELSIIALERISAETLFSVEFINIAKNEKSFESIVIFCFGFLRRKTIFVVKMRETRTRTR